MRKKYLFERVEIYMVLVALLVIGISLLGLVGMLVYRVHFFMYAMLIGLDALAFFLFYRAYQEIVLPYQLAERKLKSYQLGHDSNALADLPVYYSEHMEKTLSKFMQLFDAMNAIKLSNTHAEYRALQNQINPHFLYNTLEAIRSDALSEGMDDIAHITEALAKFFRYTISNVNNLVTLEEEIINAENYFAIQNYRFGEKIELVIHVPDDESDFMKLKVPKLTLQPIIENSIIHGLENKVGKGKIEIEFVVTEDRLLITITDDGVGMTEEVVKGINEKLKNIHMDVEKTKGTQKGGIALINVNNRLKLQYGEKYGLLLFSLPNFGTRVELICPIHFC